MSIRNRHSRMFVSGTHSMSCLDSRFGGNYFTTAIRRSNQVIHIIQQYEMVSRQDINLAAI